MICCKIVVGFIAALVILAVGFAGFMAGYRVGADLDVDGVDDDAAYRDVFDPFDPDNEFITSREGQQNLG
ncbi:Oidioi.mRNA.OKI2018_I69.PAR.g12159.t1.cds [Oikopleura dioica]|nr:Oidioi.mRNA.OKI2018_I69.PAR.g12159.t1.cds [Oikopleura dioica]